jgi:hypothetical protein
MRIAGNWTRAASLGAVLALAGGAAAVAQPVRVPLDHETVIGGVPVACTGIGQTRNDPKWLAYPVRVEFADTAHGYLAGEVLDLSDAAGQPVLQVACEGPWILLKLPPGVSYKVSARVAGGHVPPQTATIKAPSQGQARFVLTFPVAQ